MGMSDFGQTPPQRRKERYVFHFMCCVVALRLCKRVDRKKRILKAKGMDIVILLLSLALGRMLYEKNDRFREFIDKDDY